MLFWAGFWFKSTVVTHLHCSVTQYRRKCPIVRAQRTEPLPSAGKHAEDKLKWFRFWFWLVEKCKFVVIGQEHVTWDFNQSLSAQKNMKPTKVDRKHLDRRINSPLFCLRVGGIKDMWGINNYLFPWAVNGRIRPRRALWKKKIRKPGIKSLSLALEVWLFLVKLPFRLRLWSWFRASIRYTTVLIYRLYNAICRWSNSVFTSRAVVSFARFIVAELSVWREIQVSVWTEEIQNLYPLV